MRLVGRRYVAKQNHASSKCIHSSMDSEGLVLFMRHGDYGTNKIKFLQGSFFNSACFRKKKLKLNLHFWLLVLIVFADTENIISIVIEKFSSLCRMILQTSLTGRCKY